VITQGDDRIGQATFFTGLDQTNEQTTHSSGLSASWMWTLADLSTLLLTFFVLVFATTAPEEKNWKSLLNGLQSGQVTILPHSAPLPPTSTLLSSQSSDPGEDVRYVRNLLAAAQQQEPALAGITVEEENDHLRLGFPPSLSLNPQGSAIQALVRVLDRLPNQIMIESMLIPPSPSAIIEHSVWEQALVQTEVWAAFLRNAGYDAGISRNVRIIYGQEGASHGTPTAPAASMIGLLLLPEAKG